MDIPAKGYSKKGTPQGRRGKEKKLFSWRKEGLKEKRARKRKREREKKGRFFLSSKRKGTRGEMKEKGSLWLFSFVWSGGQFVEKVVGRSFDFLGALIWRKKERKPFFGEL